MNNEATTGEGRNSSLMRQIAGIPLIFLTRWSGARLVAAGATPAQVRPLRVVTTPMEPFVLPNSTPLAGFSVDIWNEVARRLQVDFTLQLVAADDRLPVLERGEADAAIGLIVMTPEAEKRPDFS